MEEDPKSRDTKLLTAQIVATIAGTLVTFNVGTMTSSMTIVNGALKESTESYNNSESTANDFFITTAEASFYATLQLLCHFAFSIFGGIVQDEYGRRTCLLISILPQFLSWIVLYNATNVYYLYAQSALIGLGTAFGEVTAIMYIGEIANVRLRGRLFSLGKIGYGLGNFATYLLANYLHWRTLALYSIILPVIAFLYLVASWSPWVINLLLLCGLSCLINLVILLKHLIPESPPWLMSKRRTDDCKRSLRWLNGWTTDDNIKLEFDKLWDYVQESEYNLKRTTETQIQTEKSNCFSKFHQKYLRLFMLPEFTKPFRILIVMFLSSYLLSLRPAKYYLINILDSLGVKTNRMRIMTVSSLAQIIGSCTLILTVRKIGKRRLTLWTFTTTAICLLFFGIYSFLYKERGFNQVWIVYVFCGSIFYFSGYTLGGMPWFICAEIFPQQIRGISSGITATFAHGLVSVMTQSYLFIQELISVTNVFYAYGIISLICCYYLYLRLPETENKTFQEIENNFKKSSEKKADIVP